MSTGKEYFPRFIAGIIIVLLLCLVFFPIVSADSNVTHPTPYPYPTHRQIPVFPGPYNTSQANTGGSAPSKILVPINLLVPTPLPTPSGNEESAKFRIFYSVPYFSVPMLVIPVHYDTMVCGDSCLFNFFPSTLENTEPINVTEQWELINSNPEITWFNPGFNKKAGSIGLIPPPVPMISACGNCGDNPGFYSLV